MYLILLTWTLFSAFDCEVVTYCLGLVVFYFGLPWTFLLSLIFNLYLLGITGISRLGFFVSGVAIIFNALIIVILIPLALRGVKYAPLEASSLLRRNLGIYGLGGVIAPFIGIKLIDVLITALGLI